MSDEIASLRRTLMWNRSAMVGVVAIIGWLMFLMIVEFRVLRSDFSDLRVQVTGIADQVQTLDQYGGRALKEHEMKAHDRAK